MLYRRSPALTPDSPVANEKFEVGNFPWSGLSCPSIRRHGENPADERKKRSGLAELHSLFVSAFTDGPKRLLFVKAYARAKPRGYPDFPPFVSQPGRCLYGLQGRTFRAAAHAPDLPSGGAKTSCSSRTPFR
jgi:hypothetical protein